MILQTLSMIFGALFPMWLRAVNTAGRDFTLRIFVGENATRLTLVFIGVFITSVMVQLDMAGFKSMIEFLGLPMKLTSHAVIGAGICSLVLAVKRNETQ